MNDPVARWVRRLNTLAREIDEMASAIHPTAWSEQLKALHASFRTLASSKIGKDRPRSSRKVRAGAMF